MKWQLFDYGVGNLHSLQKALQSVGADAHVTRDPDTLASADVAVLPGVGAFGHVMRSLENGVAGLRERHESGAPILGVCIGQQIMYEASDESELPGLGLLEGHVSRLRGETVPHMGWNTLQANGPWADFDGSHVYYVHSYAATPDANTVATTDYAGDFAAIVQQGNTLGFQFHPEKSSSVGKAILQQAVATLEAA